jgi:hypothetical protein
MFCSSLIIFLRRKDVDATVEPVEGWINMAFRVHTVLGNSLECNSCDKKTPQSNFKNLPRTEMLVAAGLRAAKDTKYLCGTVRKVKLHKFLTKLFNYTVSAKKKRSTRAATKFQKEAS